MKKIIPFFLTVFVLILSSCREESIETNEFKDIQLDEKSAQIVEADNEFGFELFQSIFASEIEYENIMVSPLSVSLALAMTYNGADGDTKTAMEETLKLYGLPPEEINTSYQTLVNALKSLDEKVILKIANAIYYSDSFSVEQDFISTNENYYDAEVSALDFNSSNAVKTINNWVADKTNDKIKTILEEISPDQVMFLLNAIYFKGIWQSEFEKSDTEEKDFYLEDGSTVQTDFMQQNNSVNYLNNDLFSAIELPYGQGNYNMYVFLPQTDKSLEDITNNLSNNNWATWQESFNEANVDIEFPKFKYEYEIKLNDVLSDMGMEVAFLPLDADFSGINKNRDLYIDYVKHKSFIEVNEEGTEAAAVTIVAIADYAADPESSISFNVNRPFLFAITEKSTGAILFIGTVKNPQLN